MALEGNSSSGSPATGRRSWRPPVVEALDRYILDHRDFPRGSRRNKSSTHPNPAHTLTPPPIFHSCVYRPHVRAHKPSRTPIHAHSSLYFTTKTRHPLRSYVNYNLPFSFPLASPSRALGDNRFSFLCSLYQQPLTAFSPFHTLIRYDSLAA
jgi:hypothetical protein